MGSWNPPGTIVSHELNILLVGPRRTGKSSTGNTLLGQGSVFDTRGGVASTAASAITAGHQVTVIDAQGWGSSQESVPRDEKIELMRALSLCGLGGPHAILLVIPLLDFTEPERRAVERRMELLTPSVWRHTMVLFTCGDLLRGKGLSAEERIRSGGPALQWLMEKCRYRYHVFNNKASVSGEKDGKKAGGKQEQVIELLGKVEDLLQENGGWHFSLHMYQRMEEEWCRREQRLRAQLQAETAVGGVRTNQTTAETKINMEQRSETEEEDEEEEGDCPRKGQAKVEERNRGEDEEEGERMELSSLSSEEEEWDVSSDSGGEREESDDVKTGLMAPFRSNGGLRLALSPIRRPEATKDRKTVFNAARVN
ncbi:GTPase IMAP family member 7 [Cheilinus undulatus]|uniref:GTPase IMAP family member 7 n=1 Tax=Cheilinus undulatus TaxID=241271 RepID=UPI001BD27957|nr:GTPase IMAP family member 7 [Cheilinus undulatus]